VTDFIPFAAPDIGEEEISSVVETLRSGWITTGPKARQFEQEFGRYLGGDVECVAVNSATAGLHLALEALEVGPGDEVIVPTYTFTATAEVVRYLGADPRLVDADPRTYCLSLDAVESAINSRTRAIVPVHFGGLACDMTRLVAIAAKHNLHIVEDAAHAFPTRWDGRLIGSLDTDAAVFSFYANKTLATGEGGMIVTRSAAVARRARVMRLHGIDRDAFERFRSTKPAWYYEVVAPGFKYNLTDIAAAIGLAQLSKVDRFLARRTQLASRYLDALAGLPLVLPPRPRDASATHAWHLFVVALPEPAPGRRDRLVQRLAEHGIGTSVHYIPLHMHPYWRDYYKLRPEAFPVASDLAQRVVSLPLHTKLTDVEQDRIIAVLQGAL